MVQLKIIICISFVKCVSILVFKSIKNKLKGTRLKTSLRDKIKNKFVKGSEEFKFNVSQGK